MIRLEKLLFINLKKIVNLLNKIYEITTKFDA